jgi:phosphopantetheine adenylyltransferase
MFDTRTKIVPVEAAAQMANGATIVAGYFDPLTDAHTTRLAVLAAEYGALLVCVCDPPAPLLPLSARAELVAACRVVKHVVQGEQALAHAAVIIDERAADLARRDALIEHVHQRQSAAQRG